MNYAIMPVLDSYQRTLSMARAAEDTVLLETYGPDGQNSQTIDPGNILVELGNCALRMLGPDGRIIDIPLDTSPVLPSITCTKIHQLIEKCRVAIQQLRQLSPYLTLTYEGKRSVAQASRIHIDAQGIWLPDGGGMDWSEYAWMTYSEKGKEPAFTIATINRRKIILRP